MSVPSSSAKLGLVSRFSPHLLGAALSMALTVSPHAGRAASFGDTAFGVAIWECQSGGCGPGAADVEFPMTIPPTAVGQNDLLDTGQGDALPLAPMKVRASENGDVAEILIDPDLPPEVRVFAAHADDNPGSIRETVAVAFFQDQLTIDVPGSPRFTELRFTPILEVSGALAIADSASISAFVEATVPTAILVGGVGGTIELDNFGGAGGGFCQAPPTGGPQDCSGAFAEGVFPPPGGAGFGGQVFDESPFTFRVGAQAYVFGALDGVADMAATIRWVGLQVSDRQGNLIEDATITSASGIDWTAASAADPCPVHPEASFDDRNGDGVPDECQCGDPNGTGDYESDDLLQVFDCLQVDPGATGACAETIVKGDANGTAEFESDDLLAIFSVLNTGGPNPKQGWELTCPARPVSINPNE